MPFVLQYESAFYRIEADVDQNLIRSEWLRPVTKDEMVTGGTQLQEALLQTGLELVVADARNLSALTPDTKEWMSTRFYELLSQTNLKKLARVIPSEVFSRLALESVVTRAEALGITKFSVRNFNTPEEGLRWVMS